MTNGVFDAREEWPLSFLLGSAASAKKRWSPVLMLTSMARRRSDGVKAFVALFQENIQNKRHVNCVKQLMISRIVLWRIECSSYYCIMKGEKRNE